MTDTVSGFDEPRSQTRIQSVSRAINLLVAIAESSDGLTARHLADRFEVSLPTSYHLLATLWAEGMLTKDDGRFRLGPRAAIIADAYQRLESVPATYHRALQRVADRTGETTYLGVWRGSGVKVLATAHGAHAVRVVGLDVGYADDLHARASGKLLLAFADNEFRELALKRMRLRKLTANTITKRADLLRELDEVRTSGIAFDRQEFQAGVDCVAAPILSNGNVVACITVSSPSPRFESTRDGVIAALLEATGDLT